jgi:glutathionylspermidine synthase
MENGAYAKRRKRIYDPLREEGIFTWDEMYGQEYALADIHPVSEAFRREIADVTERLGRIFAKTVEVVQVSGDELLAELGIPKAARRAVRLSVWPGIPTLIGRFDFARTPRGLKMLEFNSDTPTAVVEAFYVNGRVCGEFGMEDPNRKMDESIRDAFRELVGRYREKGFRTGEIVFSSLDWHEEDRGTTRFLLSRSGLDARYVPLSDVAVKGDRLYARGENGAWRVVDVWYRLHPIEILAEDEDDDGYPTGSHILHLVAGHKLALINPPGALIAQSKALQALIWNLYEAGFFYTEDERETIAAHMLPTFLENVFHGNRPYARKPFFGREGGAVTLYGAEGELLAKDVEGHYWDQPMIFQELAELETVEVETLRGRICGKLLWGSFLVGGRASAVVARVDREITGNLSHFLPVGIHS